MKNIRDLDKLCRLLELINSRVKDYQDFMLDASTSSAESSNEQEIFNNLNLLDYDNITNECLNVNLNLTTSLNDNFNFSIKQTHAISNSNLSSTISNLVRYNLVKFIYPVLLVFGLLGNFISFLAMLKKYKTETKYNKYMNNKNKPHTFSFCLALLCMADFFLLIVGCLSE